MKNKKTLTLEDIDKALEECKKYEKPPFTPACPIDLTDERTIKALHYYIHKYYPNIKETDYITSDDSTGGTKRKEEK